MGWVIIATARLLYPRERPGTHCIQCWVGPRAGLDGCVKSHLDRDSFPGHSARSDSLYRLSYLGPHCFKDILFQKEQNIILYLFYV